MIPKKSTEAIFILLQYNLLVGIISSAALAFGNLPQQMPEERPVHNTSAVEIAEYDLTADTAEENETEAETEDAEESETEPTECTEESESESEEEYEEVYEPEVSDVFSESFDSSFKAYMDYRCITDTSSVQYDMQQQAYTDSRGFRRIGDDYCVALGTGFTSGCGERFAVYLDSGYSFTAIVSDVKADVHTDSTHCYVPRGENSGNVVEFIIDSDCSDSSMLSSGNAGYFEDLSGNITAIEPI
ncbi:MAG: hypothetical protein MR503_07865 [Oscillospiraceae bacterium]|nr:hypothetical protein [Oscillospiraceae bacterium]